MQLNKAKAKRSFYTSLRYFSSLCLIVSLIALIGLIIYIVINGGNKLSFQLLFGEYKKYPSILPALQGTLILVFISTIIAIPLGIGSAIFLVEYTSSTNKIVKAIRIATETLAGIPSIVYGLFGYLIFVVSFNFGYSLLGGGLTLGLMILPTIVRSVEESLRSVPDGLKEGAYALGTSKVRTIFKIILPSAWSGILTSIILSIGRVVSESAVLILTIGMVVNKTPADFLSPGTSLALDIYYFASYGYPDEAAATSLVLLVLVIFLNLFATLIGRITQKKLGE